MESSIWLKVAPEGGEITWREEYPQRIQGAFSDSKDMIFKPKGPIKYLAQQKNVDLHLSTRM